MRCYRIEKDFGIDALQLAEIPVPEPGQGQVLVKIVTNGLKRAEKILNENLDTLHRLAAALLEREILDGPEINAIIRGEQLPPVEKRGNGEPAPVKPPAPAADGRATKK